VDGISPPVQMIAALRCDCLLITQVSNEGVVIAIRWIVLIERNVIDVLRPEGSMSG
jgi:hypothetical protein